MLNEKRVMALINHVGNGWPCKGCPARECCDLQDNHGKDDDVLCVDVIKSYIQKARKNKMITNQTMTKLKQVRLAHPFGMTQKELSIRSGVKLRTVQDYEQGRRKLYKASAITVNNLCLALGCEYEEIVDKPVD